MSEQQFDNPLVVPFGSASADNPPLPAQQHIDATKDATTNATEVRMASPYAATTTHEYDVDSGEPTGNTERRGDQTADGADADTGGNATPAQTAGADSETPPDGSIPTVLAWVGDDRDRARAALDAENEKPEPRSTLVEALEKIDNEGS
jgi:hypothetical protein